MSEDLAKRRCLPCEGGTEPLSPEQAKNQLKKVSKRWKLSSDGSSIDSTLEFANYYETTAFVNAVVWIAHQEDHHPDIQFSYRRCRVFYTTHAVKGLSDNDFICAAKIDRLIDRNSEPVQSTD